MYILPNSQLYHGLPNVHIAIPWQRPAGQFLDDDSHDGWIYGMHCEDKPGYL